MKFSLICISMTVASVFGLNAFAIDPVQCNIADSTTVNRAPANNVSLKDGDTKIVNVGTDQQLKLAYTQNVIVAVFTDGTGQKVYGFGNGDVGGTAGVFSLGMAYPNSTTLLLIDCEKAPPTPPPPPSGH